MGQVGHLHYRPRRRVFGGLLANLGFHVNAQKAGPSSPNFGARGFHERKADVSSNAVTFAGLTYLHSLVDRRAV